MGQTATQGDTLFDDPDAGARSERRDVRRLVLAGALQMVRTSRGWNVNDAASAVGIAPMTWRRLEEGQAVRRRSLAAIDKLLDLPLGGTERAIDDDLLMLDLAGRAGLDVSKVEGEDVAAFLDQLAQRFRTGTVHQKSGGAAAQALGRSIATSLAPQLTMPTDLELVNRVVEQLTRSPAVQTPAVKALIQAAAQALPDLIAQQLAEHDAQQPIAS